MSVGTTMAASIVSRSVGRKRKQEPPRDTANGLLLRYLAYLIERKGGVDAVAFTTKIHRATIFRWLAGNEPGPTLEQLDTLAKALGKTDLWALRPPKSFIDRQ